MWLGAMVHTLTHLPLDKIVVISQTTFQMHLHEWHFFYILIRIPHKFDPNGAIDNKLARVQVMAWRRTRVKPLPENADILWIAPPPPGTNLMTFVLKYINYHPGKCI